MGRAANEGRTSCLEDRAEYQNMGSLRLRNALPKC
jgi:hypothetical protein